GEGAVYYTNTLSLSAGSTYTGSVWLLAGSGSVNVWVRYDGPNASYSGPQTLVTMGLSWQRVVVSATVPSDGKSYTSISLMIRTPTAQALTFHTDGAQLEAGSLSTPYIDTNGASASRAGARVQVPTTLLAAGQGWVAL